MGRFQIKSLLTKLSMLLAILIFQTFSVNASGEEEGELSIQKASVQLINKVIESPQLEGESFFSTAGSLKRHLAYGKEGVDSYVNFVPVVFKTRSISVAPTGCLLRIVNEDEESIQSTLARHAQKEEYLEMDDPSPKYKAFVDKYSKTPSDALFSSYTNLPVSVLQEAMQAVEENEQNITRIKLCEDHMTQWFLTAPKYSFLLYALGMESITVMHVYTSEKPLATEVDGVNNLREQLMNNDDPTYTQFKPLLAELQIDKLNTNGYLENRKKRITFKPSIESTTVSIMDFQQVVDALKMQWLFLLEDMSAEIDRKDKMKGHSNYH